MKYRFATPFIFVLVLLLFACARKPQDAQHVRPPVPGAEIADLREFPQNLEIYAKEAGKNKRLVSQERQAALNGVFDGIYFGPWSMRKTTIPRREVAGVFGRARGYKFNSVPWSQTEWDAIRANADLRAYPSRATQAITLRPTNLREVPTDEPKFSKPTPDPKADPFDYIQYSQLSAGMPLLIVHTSTDLKWHYVECPITGGWVAARDVAPVDENFKAEWRTGKYAALVRDDVVLPGTGPGGGDAKAGIGTILPFVKKNGNSLNVLAPVRTKNGMAGTAEITLKDSDAAVKPLPLTPGNVAAVGNAMMGQPYGWGAWLGNRDCSSMLRDLFTPFGLWLPRNSAAQARGGHVIRLDGMSPSQKADIILRDGEPFLSLVGLPGHITLYVGRWQGRPALFHNVWGLRIIKDGNDDERHVIGRAVVTSIMPGMELENLYRPRTFVDRIRSLNNPAQK